MKEFVTAAADQEKVENGEPIKVKYDGKECTFFKPDDGQIAVMMGLVHSDKDDEQVMMKRASTFIALFFEMMDDDTRVYFEDRLLTRSDPFGLKAIIALFKNLVEDWSDRPTKRPAASRSSRRASGKSSTATTRAKASTSSRSRTRASSR